MSSDQNEIGHLDTTTAQALHADADRLRAETARPDTKASVLAAIAAGAVIAGAGHLTDPDMPMAATVTGGAAITMAVAAVIALLVAMRPGISTSPDALITTNIRDAQGQIEAARNRIATPDLVSLASERAALQRLAVRKFWCTRWAIDAAIAAIVLAVAAVVIVLVGHHG